MTFEQFYASPAQQPVLLWCAAAVGLAIVAARRSVAPSVRVFTFAFGLLPFFDAWLTADPVMGMGTGSLGPTLGLVVPIVFVVLGDFRVLLFLAAATREGEITLTGRKVAHAFLLSLAVPVASAIVRAFLPEAPWKAQATFLVYELAFVGLVLVLLATRWGATRFPWGRRVTTYVLAYYGLWAAADVLILGLHADAGYLLRVVPNVLYYGGLLAAISLSAPARSPDLKVSGARPSV